MKGAEIQYKTLERFLSAERLGTYLRMAENDKQRATVLYLQNLQQSQALYSSLHWLEIGLRNAMNRQLSQKYGTEWYDNAGAGLNATQHAKVAEAKKKLQEAKKPLANGDIVAELSFGFWVNLFNKPYDELWRKCLVRAFPNHAGGVTRKAMWEKLRPVLRLRNRVAHYEPILSAQLPRMQQDIHDIVRWIDPEITATSEAD